MRLLNIESSPRGSKSASIAVTSAFIEAYRQACPPVMVDERRVTRQSRAARRRQESWRRISKAATG